MPSNPNKNIIADTSCLIGLKNIGQTDTLHKMYGSILKKAHTAAKTAPGLLRGALKERVAFEVLEATTASFIQT